MEVFSEMKLFLMSMVLLLSASMTSATMNVGTFWFAQNNGKYYPLKPYTILKAEEENARNLIKQRQEVRQQHYPNWWTHYILWKTIGTFG